MTRKITAVLLAAGLLVVMGASTASAGSKGPHPQPPKCVPANTPGCS